ncbi:integral peroxisomal membrane peroxin-domain-containing protein [Coprinopsis sp. MPI-PUGE-AT-0042]|nr:integral peroxisomal membrane peroxin-domain-containing protein [Coprinopsis sp. MPI-PUGE-AT-0042]
MASSAASTTSSTQPVGLSDFVNSVPSPLTFALVSLSDQIALLKSLLQLLNWRSKSWFDGFLAVAAWWAFCRFSGPILRYFVPVLVLGVAVYTRRRPPQPSRPPVVTETLLQNTISDLTTLPLLLPSIPSTAPLSSLSIQELARALVVLYIPYLVLTYFIPLHVIFAISGTVLLTWKAPFAIVLRRTVWRSAFVRWTIWSAWSYVSGRPLPTQTISPQTQTLLSKTEKTAEDKGKAETNSLRFLFTVYENQRWWMGLDWTAALLPGERPSWCSASQAPLSPPGAFGLPEPATTCIPHPSDPTKKIKRTAEWYWEEPEWRVLVKKEGTTLSRVERPVPTESMEDEDAAGTSATSKAGSRLLKAASSKFAGKDAMALHRRDSSSTSTTQQDPTAQEVEEGAEEDTEGYTDPDGWIFGDNKWESKSNKGGMGKYTRYRRWTRVAVLTEFSEVVDATTESKPALRPKGTKPSPMILEDPPVATNQAPASAPVLAPLDVTSSPVPTSAPPSAAKLAGDLNPASPLKQRLRQALHKGSHGTS